MPDAIKLKFEGFKPGQLIRARDFEDRPGRGPCFIEGRIDMVCRNGSRNAPYAHYQIIPTRHVYNGSVIACGTDPVYVPMEVAGFGEYDNRVTLVEEADADGRKLTQD